MQPVDLPTSCLHPIKWASWSSGFQWIYRSHIYKHKWALLYDLSCQRLATSRICSFSDARMTMPIGTLPRASNQNMVSSHHGHPCPHVQCSHMGSKLSHVHMNTNREITSQDSIMDVPSYCTTNLQSHMTSIQTGFATIMSQTNQKLVQIVCFQDRLSWIDKLQLSSPL